MVEHVSIQDADRHEAKGASAAANNQVLHSNGNGTTSFKFVDFSNVANIRLPVGYQSVISGFSTAASQAPAAVDVVKQIEFGAGSVSTSVSLDAAGLMTFHEAGYYIITLFLRFGRTALAGTSILLNRIVVNGAQALNTNAVKLPDQDTIVPFSASISFQAEVGDTLALQILRDSAGNNAGGVYRILPTVVSWNLAPSASIQVSKFVGSQPI